MIISQTMSSSALLEPPAGGAPPLEKISTTNSKNKNRAARAPIISS